MSNQNNKRTAIFMFAVLVSAATAEAAPIAGVSYVYNNLAELESISGKDAPTGVAQALTDGLGQAGVYTPTNFFWFAGQEGTIYMQAAADIPTQANPSVTFDLGGVYALDDLDVHYGVYSGAFVQAPAAVDVTVGSTFIGTFGGFDNSNSVGGFGDIRSKTISLAGVTGQFITLDFTGTVGSSWVGLTEIEFEGTALAPEPSSFLLAGLALVGLTLRRRRRNRA